MRRDEFRKKTKQPAASWLDAIAECLVIAILAFSPLALGSVDAWSRLTVVLGIVALIGTMLVSLFVRRDAPLVRSWSFLPIALFLVWVGLELVSLPGSWVRILSPHTLGTKAALLATTHAAPQEYWTLTFYKLATQDDLIVVLCAAALFTAVLNLYRRKEQIERLLLVIALLGAGIGVLQLAQLATGTTQIYWSVPLDRTDPVLGGPFVNRNNFAQYMELATGAGLGLLMLRGRRQLESYGPNFPGVRRVLRDRESLPVWFLAAFVLLGLCSIVLSLSRGGTFAVVVALVLTILALSRSRLMAGWAWAVAGVAVLAFGCILYLGFDSLYARVASLQHETNNRWQIVKDLTVVWRQFPVTGTGLGTHEFVYPAYDHSDLPTLARHAEDEYAQLIEETGFVGLILVLSFVAFIANAWWRVTRHGSPSRQLLAYGLGFGLLAVMIHSTVDFAMHVPGVGLLAAVFCALLVRLSIDAPTATQASTSVRSLPPVRPLWRPVQAWAGALLVVIVSGWMVTHTYTACAAESLASQARQLEADLAQDVANEATDSDYRAVVTSAFAAASDAQPGNITLRYNLAACQWRSISRLHDDQTGQILLPDTAREDCQRIVGELDQALTLCPTFGPAHSLAGQLQRTVLGNPAGAQRIRLAARLTPSDVYTGFLAAQLDVEEGKWQDSLEQSRRVVAQGRVNFADFADLYVKQANRPDLAIELAGDNDDNLLVVASALNGREDQKPLTDQITAKVLQLRTARIQKSDAPATAVAWVAAYDAEHGQRSKAIEYYRRALAIDYSQAGWHLELARQLDAVGELEPALNEARVSLRLDPQLPAAKDLVITLANRSAAAAGPR